MPVDRVVVAVGEERRRPKLVVLRALGLGDLLTAVPALRALAEAFPGHRRVLAAPAMLAPLVELAQVSSGAPDRGDGGRGQPVVHEVVPSAGLKPLHPALGRSDIAVNLHGRGPESHRLLLAAGTGRLIAFQHPEVAESRGAPRWDEEEHETARWCRLLSESGIPADRRRIELSRPRSGAPAQALAATLLHPGAASPARCWPAERWAAVAREAHALGRRVAITGDRAEVPAARLIAEASGLPPDAVLAGRTDLRQLAASVAVAARVVCGDTGVAHLATAFSRPSVLLFGPTSPDTWGPPADRPWHRTLWSGRTGDPHGRLVDAGLLEITPDEVVAALAELPEDRSADVLRSPVAQT